MIQVGNIRAGCSAKTGETVRGNGADLTSWGDGKCFINKGMENDVGLTTRHACEED